MKRWLTFDAAYEGRQQWSPSGRDISFQSGRDVTHDIFRRAADGTSEAELLFGTEARETPYGWSRHGSYLVYTAGSVGNTDVWYLKRKDDAGGFESVPYLASPFNENAPTLSRPLPGLLFQRLGRGPGVCTRRSHATMRERSCRVQAKFKILTKRRESGPAPESKPVAAR